MFHVPRPFEHLPAAAYKILHPPHSPARFLTINERGGSAAKFCTLVALVTAWFLLAVSANFPHQLLRPVLAGPCCDVIVAHLWSTALYDDRAQRLARKTERWWNEEARGSLAAS